MTIEGMNVNTLLETIVSGRVLVRGEADGEVCGTRDRISFWGGYDPATGKVVDRHHSLCGETLTSKIFVLPKGKGSSTGSYVLLDAMVSGNAPAGIILNKVDEIISLGVIVCEEFFDKKIPIVVLEDEDFSLAVHAKTAKIHEDGTVALYE
ncbi:aconitase X swivel domain-containing protein [Neobacillus sp. NPDC097160]|uniref:aconitase X swivel domain-containing protein n=1 Tax=Neobacillus sp. NPDC097160 TaxID=3364298 RepID=UPI00381C336E